MSTDQPRLNILVLHRLGNPRLARSFLLKHVYFLGRYAPEHNYLYHDAILPPPSYLADFPFDGILLDVTFLGARYLGMDEFEAMHDRYAFIADSPAYKIAMPQDEYDCHAILDDWVSELNVNRLYSVIPSHWDILYPRFHASHRIRLGYTGYVDDNSIAPMRARARPFRQRTRDVVYRAKKLAPYFGKVGETKWRIASSFATRAVAAGLTCDISVREQDTILGDHWLDFLGDARFTLGSPSGSSLLDPRGEIQRRVRAHVRENPNADHASIVRNVLGGVEPTIEFTAISPRNLEAALMQCAQILVPGNYTGLLEPWTHYIPLSDDCSNFSEVLEAMRDENLIAKLHANCETTLIENPSLRYSHLARQVIDEIATASLGARRSPDSLGGQRLLDRYREDTRREYAWYWRRHTIRDALARRAPSLERTVTGWVRRIRKRVKAVARRATS